MHILMAIDGSEECYEAARLLTRLPFDTQPLVTVLTVIDESAAHEHSGRILEMARTVSRQHYAVAQRILEPTGYPVQHAERQGHPSRVILEVAKELDVDLIAVGARGHNVIHRVVLGSTADYVATRAPCSVLVVRPQTTAKISGGSFSVLLAYDGSPSAKIAQEQMFEFHWPADSTSIHVSMLIERPRMLPPSEVYDAKGIAEAEKSMPIDCQSPKCPCNISYSVRETLHPGSALVDIAEGKQANIVFLGGIGHSPVERFFLGSTTKFLLHHAACAIWVARKKG